MHLVLTILHFILCFILIGVILLQAGKGADIGAAFGAGGSQTVFGPRGATTFLSKMTAAVAILFLLTSITLARMARQGPGGSVLEKYPAKTEVQTPQTTPQEAPSANVPQPTDSNEKK